MEILTTPIIDFAGVTLTRAEAVGFIAALAALGLAIRRDPLTFAAIIVAHLISLVLMAGYGVVAQVAVQVVFIALAAHGWWMWSRHRGTDGRVQVARMTQVELIVYPVVALLVAAPLSLVYLRAGFGGGIGSALLLTGGIAAQLALNFRRVENWIIRIVVDVVGIFVFVSYGGWVAVLFHLVFIALAVKGWRDWRRALQPVG